jgi:environmental stress-induced protein Ves
MKYRIVQTRDAALQPWSNGGGQTRELLTWANEAESPWRLRISVAAIDRDGPFSPLPDVQRWFAVLSGKGVHLQWPGRECTLVPGDAPIEFDGASAPSCRLLAGATSDLNFMLRGGRGRMSAADAGKAYRPTGARAGLYAVQRGILRIEGGESIELPAAALAWFDAVPPGSTWQFFPGATIAAPALGFWLDSES